MGINERAIELAQKFDAQWGPFTRALAEHPKTALAVGFIAGFLVAIGLALIF